MNNTVNTIDTATEFCDVRVTDFDYIQTIFRFLHKKLGVQGHESFKCPSLDDQHHDVFFFFSCLCQ